jgi:hypothetical protein
MNVPVFLKTGKRPMNTGQYSRSAFFKGAFAKKPFGQNDRTALHFNHSLSDLIA